MKNNSFSVRSLLGVLMAFMLMVVLFEACKKDDNPTVTPADKSKLNARIDSANTAYNAAVEGVQVGQYETGSKATFKALIDAATTVKSNANATQTDVNNAYTNLGQAMTTFANKKVQEIAPQNLVLYLKMDGNTNDASGKGFNGTLKAGAAKWGAGTPTLTKDRYGVADKAYHFFKGGNIEVPYNSALNPSKEITLSVWARMDSTRENNYIIALNRWNGYKLNLQKTDKAFFTVKTSNNGIQEEDHTDPSLNKNQWYHIAVSYKSGDMSFYINGVLTKTWTTKTGDPIGVKSNINLVIGQDLPTSIYTNDQKDNADGNNFFVDWGGYFGGDLDEVRIYNVALSGTQVKSIYTAEKP